VRIRLTALRQTEPQEPFTSATDRGVFLARADLNALGTVSTWTRPKRRLPDTAARDVKLAGDTSFRGH